MSAASADYLEQITKPDEIIGLSSWSKTFMAMVDAMNPMAIQAGAQMVQVLGGVGNPAMENHAVHLVRRLAGLVQGQAVLLWAPGVVGTAETRQLYPQDPFVAAAIEKYDQISLCLVSIGSVEPSDMLASSGYGFSAVELCAALILVPICICHIHRQDGLRGSTSLGQPIHFLPRYMALDA